MNLQKALDAAIKITEVGKDDTSGYRTSTGFYTSYVPNNEWKAFIEDMMTNHEKAYESYGSGGGKELEERRSGGNVFPPKMASYGSSSRMIYKLAKDITGFEFEKKLPTIVGGTANLDGFIETGSSYIFTEAKCREPYSANTSPINRKYEELYNFISMSEKTSLVCAMNFIDDKSMKVDFSCNGTAIRCFDIKQMICHLLGVSAAVLDSKFNDKELKFLYLLFDPSKIDIPDAKVKETIVGIYRQVCAECAMIDFEKLFEVIYDFLAVNNDDKPALKFMFEFCGCEDFTGRLI